ncbi:MAG: hypothetical protein GY820_36375 [Gammaproteobacteria bacterium]|nr:hypothetical protein [Gammaproteobacteria bacterium]
MIELTDSRVWAASVSLFGLFIVLRVTGVIAWPWEWVFAPLWVSFLLFALKAWVVVIVENNLE